MGNISLVLTGATTALIAGLIYQFTDNAFMSQGRFRGKEEALTIYLGSLLFIGLITPAIHSYWANTIATINKVRGIGAIMILGMYIVNRSVTNWKHTDEKSLVIYLAGLILLILP